MESSVTTFSRRPWGRGDVVALLVECRICHSQVSTSRLGFVSTKLFERLRLDHLLLVPKTNFRPNCTGQNNKMSQSNLRYNNGNDNAMCVDS